MSENFLWSTYGVGDLDDWDMAAIPSYNGKQTSAAFNADTFRILKSSKHPDEAFQFLTYLLGDASQDLLTAYGGFPARTADQQAGIAALQAQFKNTVDWQVAVDGANFPDNPNFESWMPAYNESLGLIGSGGKYLTRWGTTRGAGHGHGDRQPEEGSAGDLGQGALSLHRERFRHERSARRSAGGAVREEDA